MQRLTPADGRPSTEWLIVPVPSVADDFVCRIADGLGGKVLSYRKHSFANQNMLVEFDDLTPRPHRVLLVHEGYGAEDGRAVELGLVADAQRRLGADEIWCLLRYLPYSRSNRLAGRGTSLGAKVFVDVLSALPVDRYVTFNLHSPELLGFFGKPVYALNGLPLIADTLRQRGRGYDVVMGTDRGRYDECAELARTFGCDIDFYLKVRADHSGASRTLEQDKSYLSGLRVLLFDDEIETGQSSFHTVTRLAEIGVAAVDMVNFYDFARPGVYQRLADIECVRSAVRTNLSGLANSADPPLSTITVDMSALVSTFLS